MDSQGPVLSVRGDARQSVQPDTAGVSGALEVAAESKQAALAEAHDVTGRIIADLTALGGVVQSSDTERHPLTWSTRNVVTRPETINNHQTHRSEETGRMLARVTFQFRVRDFGLLDPLNERLAAYEMFSLHWVNWHVDEDNPSWRRVRAEAIQAAIRQGRDYANALGCSLVRVEQVADSGLLDGGRPQSAQGGWARAATMGVDASRGNSDGGPSLDPVPQELTATIEARFTTTPVTLPED